MKKFWLSILLGTLLVIIVPVITVIDRFSNHSERPLASGGRMDLSGWNFDKGPVPLSGEWEFYPGRLLAPADFQGGTPEAGPHLAQVPGNWRPAMPEKAWNRAVGYGTYRLLVDIPQQGDRLYGVRVLNIRSSSRVFMNGEEIGSSGTPAAAVAEGRQSNIPYFGFASHTGGTAEIIIQASNFSYHSGGIVAPVLLGDAEAILTHQERSLTLDWTTFICLIVLSGFLLMLSRVRDREGSVLHLGLLCVSASVYVLTHGEKLIDFLIPGLNYVFVMKIQLISATLIYYFLLKYVSLSVQHSISRRVWNIYLGLTIAQILIASLLHPLIFSRLEPFLLLYAASTIGFAVYVMLMGLIRNRENIFLNVVSIQSILAAIVVNIFSLAGLELSRLLIPYEIVLFILVQSVMMTKRYAASFREIESLSRRLLVLDALKDEFMAKTSHELKMPLADIVNLAHTMGDGAAGPLTDIQRRELSMIVSTGARLTALIGDMSDFAKLNHGDLAPRPQAVDLRMIVVSVVEVMREITGTSQLEFRMDLPHSLPLVEADNDRLSQILFTLLGNAVKHTPRGVIEVTAEVRGREVAVTVSDTGEGIPEERLVTLFEPFIEADEGVREYRNAGLGLNITLKLVELYGGRMAAESKPGEGSRFTFTLPALSESLPLQTEHETAAETAAAYSPAAYSSAEPAAGPPAGDSFPLCENSLAGAGAQSGMNPQSGAESHSAAELSSPAERDPSFRPSVNEGGQCCRILIVDDDPVNTEVLLGALRLENHQVIAVDSGPAALQQVQHNPNLDLVILDWLMPDMSGLSLLKAIRERFVLSELPVLLLTTRSRPEDLQAAFGAGVNDFLSKPVDLREFTARVRTLLDMRKSARASLRAEIAYLQAQIKPHFLYNALNAIIAVCPDDPDKATELLLELSQYLRSSFDFQNRNETVPIQKELELVRSYLALEKARFDDRLEMEWDLPGELYEFLPPLVIQPLVENAINHGILRRESGGIVRLTIRLLPAHLLVTVSDNGIGMTEEQIRHVLSDEHRGGIGLKNIRRRLMKMYGEGLMIESEPGAGTHVSFRLPRLVLNDV
ncbi:ATP-binding protein [Paenibacillus sp. CN-4]|uniref:hybrid sensor histidine kinase/response regulator n=1 Tax=Paenibacillus nanchangensis TaxID=3348343 RepID=UPI00397A04E9